jgi:hypothetical protein
VFLKKIIRHINRIPESDTRESIKIRFHILAHFRIGTVNRTPLLILPDIQMGNIICAVANSHHVQNEVNETRIYSIKPLFHHNSRDHIYRLQLLKQEFA